jgi:hypothetical protein
VKTDTLTGPNLSHWAAIVYGCSEVEIFTDYSTGYEWKDGVSCIFPSEQRSRIFDYADPATFQPIAEREKISCGYLHVFEKWQASTTCKKSQDGERYRKKVYANGDTEAEARMRCYVKSYLGDDTKE